MIMGGRMMHCRVADTRGIGEAGRARMVDLVERMRGRHEAFTKCKFEVTDMM